jgi:hypothetical protein
VWSNGTDEIIDKETDDEDDILDPDPALAPSVPSVPANL